MERVEPALVPRRKLSNGMVIPGIGMGTFGNDRFSPEQTAEAVYGAIKAGYRLFDCAADGTSGRHGSGKKYWYVKYDDYKTGTDITALQDQTDCIGSGDEPDISAAETF